MNTIKSVNKKWTQNINRMYIKGEKGYVKKEKICWGVKEKW